MSHRLLSTTLEAAVRTHFGLTQAELGRYLGVSAGQVAHLEAGRRRSPPLVTLRLVWLARWLPAPEGTGPVAPPVPAFATPAVPAALLPEGWPLPGPLAAGPLAQRQRACAQQLLVLRRELTTLTELAVCTARRRWALGVLEAALAAAPVALADEAAERAHRRRWLDELVATVPEAPARRPDTATALALVLVRLAAVEAEAAAVARLLAATT